MCLPTVLGLTMRVQHQVVHIMHAATYSPNTPATLMCRLLAYGIQALINV